MDISIKLFYQIYIYGIFNIFFLKETHQIIQNSDKILTNICWWLLVLVYGYFKRAELGPVFLSQVGQPLEESGQNSQVESGGCWATLAKVKRHLRYLITGDFPAMSKTSLCRWFPVCAFSEKRRFDFLAVDEMLCTNNYGIIYY